MFDIQEWVPPTEQGYYDRNDWWVDTTPNPWWGTEERDTPLPAGLEDAPPGPRLSEMLAGIDPTVVSGYDLITVVQAFQRMISHYQAGYYRVIAELSGLDRLPTEGLASSEVAAALHLTRSAADHEYHLALQLGEHPPLLDELRAGRLDIRRVRVILEQASTLSNTDAEILMEKVLPGASELTTGQLRAKAKRIAMSLNPAQTTETYAQGLDDRRVVVNDNPDGTANLFLLNGPPTEINLARQRLEELTRQARTPDDMRSIDQIRADTLLDILLGHTTIDLPTAAITLVVELETLIGLADNPAEIPGYGPVIAEIARKTGLDNTNGQWDFITRDQGQPIATGTLRRRPTQAMKRRIRAQYPTCVHPGCRQPAHNTDIDHTIPWATHGKTRHGNLAPLCEHHHQLKDQGWQYTIQPDQTITWTSPLGHTYINTGQSP